MKSAILLVPGSLTMILRCAIAMFRRGRVGRCGSPVPSANQICTDDVSADDNDTFITDSAIGGARLGAAKSSKRVRG
jgi:hypothetical protein